MTNQTPCNHRTPPKYHVSYCDNQMVIVNGVAYSRKEPTPIVIHEDENTIVVRGVKYQKVEEKRTPTIYEFLVQCETGEYDSPDLEKRIEIENYAINLLNYLYECCETVKENDEELVVSILKTQMVMPND